MPVTSWPEPMSSGISRRPIAPLAPARKILILRPFSQTVAAANCAVS
jgi:hypothetical protein